jgi:hypothetical protein
MPDPRDEPLSVDEIFALYQDGAQTPDRVRTALQLAWNMATIKTRQEEIERAGAQLSALKMPGDGLFDTDEPDGECFRGREAERCLAEQQARVQRELK